MRKSQNLGTKKLVGRWGRFYSFRTKKLLEWTFPILYYGPQGKNVDYYPRRRIYGCKKLRVLLLSAGEGAGVTVKKYKKFSIVCAVPTEIPPLH